MYKIGQRVRILDDISHHPLADIKDKTCCGKETIIIGYGECKHRWGAQLQYKEYYYLKDCPSIWYPDCFEIINNNLDIKNVPEMIGEVCKYNSIRIPKQFFNILNVKEGETVIVTINRKQEIVLKKK